MLFDENLGFFGFTIPQNIENNNLTSVKNGFIKGNMFNNLYDKYKNYEIKEPIPTSKKEELLLEIMSLSFAINDINLYLDLYPKDEYMLKKFKELTEEAYKKEMQYVNMYGPLEVMDNESLTKFEWINSPWPWQNEGGTKYV